MLGNKTNAQIAEILHLKQLPVPDGWKFLGKGVSRKVYLGPDRVAYKVNRYKNSPANSIEFEALSKFRTKMAGSEFNLPAASMYGDVLAMQYVEKSKTKRFLAYCPDCGYFDEMPCKRLRCLSRLSMAAQDLGYIDFGVENCLIDKSGRYWLIDFHLED